MNISFFSKKALSSLFITLLIVPIIFFALPTKKAEAGWPTWNLANVIQSTVSAITNSITAGVTSISASTDVSNFLKTYVLDTVATAFARTILRRITAQTVNWINTGFKGNPAFVTDPGQFFLNVGDQTASQYFLGANSPLNQLCTAFQPQVRLALVKNHIQEDQFQSQCTFAKIGANFESFTRDFNQGGWEAWITMTQESQNNPYGAYFDASRQLSARVNVQNTKYDKQLAQGKGFLSFETCPQGKTYAEVAAANPSTGGGVGDDCNDGGNSCKPGLACSGENKCVVVDNSYIDDNGEYTERSLMGVNGADCTTAKKTVTPGSVISEKLTKSLNSTETTLELTNSINQVISALMTEMISQTFNSIQGGLRGLSKKQPGQTKTLLEQVQASSSQASFQAEKAEIQATVPAQFQPALTGGEPTGLYTPPSEEDVRARAELDRQRYCLENNNGVTLINGVPGTDVCGRTTPESNSGSNSESTP